MNNNIDFTYNWNNKLACLHALTTLRLRNDHKYRIGETYPLSLKGRFICYAVIHDIKHFYLKDINDYIAYLDTGYPADECRNMIRTMYKKRVRNWDTQQLSFILLIKIKNHAKSYHQAGVAAEAPGLLDPNRNDRIHADLPCGASV